MNARLLAALTLAVGLLVAAAAASASGGPAELTAHRVVAPAITPTPAPTAVPTSRPADTSGLNGLRWVPSGNAGPWPTNGTVELPTLGVKAPIVRVGVDAKGQMVTPRNGRDVAWLDQGPIPGMTRNVVLAGHRNWQGRPGSFERLEKLRDGDPVILTMDGRTWRFAVRWVRMYDPDTAPAADLMGRTDEVSVTLITCGGRFNRATRHYESRWLARGGLGE